MKTKKQWQKYDDNTRKEIAVQYLTQRGYDCSDTISIKINNKSVIVETKIYKYTIKNNGKVSIKTFDELAIQDKLNNIVNYYSNLEVRQELILDFLTFKNFDKKDDIDFFYTIQFSFKNNTLCLKSNYKNIVLAASYCYKDICSKSLEDIKLFLEKELFKMFENLFNRTQDEFYKKREEELLQSFKANIIHNVNDLLLKNGYNVKITSKDLIKDIATNLYFEESIDVLKNLNLSFVNAENNSIFTKIKNIVCEQLNNDDNKQIFLTNIVNDIISIIKISKISLKVSKELTDFICNKISLYNEHIKSNGLINNDKKLNKSNIVAYSYYNCSYFYVENDFLLLKVNFSNKKIIDISYKKDSVLLEKIFSNIETKNYKKCKKYFEEEVCNKNYIFDIISGEGLLFGDTNIKISKGSITKDFLLKMPMFSDSIAIWKKTLKNNMNFIEKEFEVEKNIQAKKLIEENPTTVGTFIFYDILKLIKLNESYITATAVIQYLRGINVQLGTTLKDIKNKGKYNCYTNDEIEYIINCMISQGFLKKVKYKGTYGDFYLLKTTNLYSDLLNIYQSTTKIVKEKFKNNEILNDFDCEVELKRILSKKILSLKDYNTLLSFLKNKGLFCFYEEYICNLFKQAPDNFKELVKMKIKLLDKTQDDNKYLIKVYKQILK